MVICLKQGADLHTAQPMPLPLTVSCFSKIQIGFTFLVPAHPGSLKKRAVKRVCVCVYLSKVVGCRRRVVGNNTVAIWHTAGRPPLWLRHRGSLVSGPVRVVEVVEPHLVPGQLRERIRQRRHHVRRHRDALGHGTAYTDNISLPHQKQKVTGSGNAHTHTHTHTRPFNSPLSGTTRVSQYRSIWILLKQVTVSGNGISWAICKPAARSRQTTTPAPHHSVFYRPDALPAAQPTASKH